jgi:tetratricopeptide (TPR) repeat protein
MNQIKAFIAYSFSPSDKELTDIFIEHFRNLEKVLPHFSWDHAQEAAPVPVSDKVLSKIEGKNVFVAICSRNERVIGQSAITRFPFLGFVTINEAAIKWKTSDWIIQEIGLAVGRRLKVIVFLEDGLRKPGGLIGDIEYIPFSRSNLLPSFEKLLQMLGSLTPRPTPPTALVETAAAPEEKKEAQDTPDYLEPGDDWDQERYNSEVFRAIVFGRSKEAVQKLDSSYRKTPLAVGEALAVWEARIEYLWMLGGGKADFDKVKRLQKGYPKNRELLIFLGGSYQHYEDYEIAARTYEEAAANAGNEGAKFRDCMLAMRAYSHAGRFEKVRKIESALRNQARDSVDLQIEMLLSFQDLAEIEKNIDLKLAVMEQLVELRPDDVSRRFSLAYEHYERGNRDMALHHYLKIPWPQRDSTTWNNLGVSYGEFGLPVRAVSAWRTSANQNDSLAMSNLGFKLLGAGFLEEARKECDKALAIERYHTNVPELLKRVTDTSDDEAKKLDEALVRIKPKAVFYRNLGEAVLRPNATDIAKEWNSPDGVLQAKIEGDAIRIFGAQERPENPFAGALAQATGGGLGLLLQKKVIHRTEFNGRLRGDTISGDVKRSRDGEQPSLLAEAMSNPNVVMYFNPNHTELFVMENPQGHEPRFYSLTRVV